MPTDPHDLAAEEVAPLICPKCSSDDTSHRKVRFPDYSTDKDWDECNACGHEWNEG